MASSIAGLDALPGSSEVYSLPELINMGERLNPETRIAWEQATQAAEGIGIARSELFPILAFNTLALKGNLLFGLPPNLSSEGVVKINSTIVEPAFNLTWTLFDFGGKQANYKRSQFLALAARMALHATHENVARGISEAFYRLLTAKEQLRAATVANSTSLTTAKAVQERFDQNLASAVELDRARAQQLSTYAKLVRAKSNVAKEKVALAARVGFEADKAPDIAPLDDVPSPQLIESSADEFAKQALEQRPDLLRAAYQVRAADYEVKHARAELFPKISIDASEQYTSTSNSPNSSSNPAMAAVGDVRGNTYVVAGRLNWVIFDTFARRDRLRQARSQVREANERLRNLKINAEQEVWGAYVNVITALREQDAAKTSRDAASASFRSSQQAYTSGKESILNLLTSQSALADAESSYAEARAHTLEGAAELAYSSGTLLASGPKLPKQVVTRP